MKVTSFKEVENYLYTSVILPLKGIEAPELNFSSPIKGDDGKQWTIMLEKAPIERRYRRNYQNDQAERRRNWEILVETGSPRLNVIGVFDIKTKVVYLYEQQFKSLNAVPLMGKMHDLFNRQTPFSRVEIKESPLIPRPRRQRGETFVNAEDAGDYEEWDGEDDI